MLPASDPQPAAPPVTPLSAGSGLPAHLALIMDGNGRWAEARGLPRLAGHAEGARVVREVTTACREVGLRELTLYAFSSENWARPLAEVEGLMDLLASYLRGERATLVENGIELAAIGDLARLPARVRAALDEVRAATRGLGGMRLTLALSYGGRDEIVRAARALASAAARGDLDPAAIDEARFAAALDAGDRRDPDLVIRTGGEERLSNFLLWQCAYAELRFTDTPWPAFGRAELESALADYARRRRRFGRTDAQLALDARPGVPPRRRGAPPARPAREP